MTAQEKPKPDSGAEVLTAHLRSGGRRCTPERYMVLEAAESFFQHFTVDDVVKVLEADKKHVAIATVYSTLEIMVEAGLLRRLQVGSSAAVYEQPRSCHAHSICSDCGRIKDLKLPAGFPSQFKVAAFSQDFAMLTVVGLCSACARKRKKKISQNISTKPSNQ